MSFLSCRYFGTQLETAPIISGFAKHESYYYAGNHGSPSVIPQAFKPLPRKLEATPEMTAVDTASMPHATAVLYNNFPREPTSSPAFMMKYCQRIGPLGTRLTVDAQTCHDVSPFPL